MRDHSSNTKTKLRQTRNLKCSRNFSKSSLLLVLGLSFLSINSTESSAQEVNVKNFRQMYSSLVAATGLNARNPVLQRTLREVRSRLPQQGSASEVTTTAILAYTALAGVFCKKLIESDARQSNERRRAHRGVNFTGDQTQFDGTLKDRLTNRYAELFLQRPANSEELSAASTLFDEAGGIEAVSSSSVPKVLETACTSIAASLEAFTYR